MVKAYSYIRFSTPEQLKGDSLRRQAEASQKYAEEHGLELDKTLNLRDLGISAYDKSNIKKGALGYFVDLVNSGKIPKGSFLLVENLDRLSRGQVMDALELFLGILNAEITIVTLMDNQTYSREGINLSMTNLIMSIVIMSRASEESVTKSKRIRASWDQKRATINSRRLTARCPYWLKPSAGKTGFEFIPEHTETVKQIFQMAKDGFGNSLITKSLNEKNVKPFSTKTDGWQPSYIQKLLRNPAIYGELHLQTQRDGKIEAFGEPISNYYPVLLSKEEWLLINHRRESRSSKGGAHKGRQLTNLFSGLLICGHCNGTVVLGAHTKTYANGERKQRKFVACSRARRGLGCKHLTWSYTELEGEILKFCKSIDFAEILRKNTLDPSEKEKLEKLKITIELGIVENKKRLTQLIDLIEQGQLEALESISTRIKELESSTSGLIDQKQILEDRILKLEIEHSEYINRADTITELIQNLENLNGQDLLELRLRLSHEVKRSVNKIALYPGGPWIQPEKQKELKSNMIKSGASVREVNKYLNELSEPNRIEKFFTIIFHDGQSITVNKSYTNEFPNPNKLKINEQISI